MDNDNGGDAALGHTVKLPPTETSEMNVQKGKETSHRLSSSIMSIRLRDGKEEVEVLKAPSTLELLPLCPFPESSDEIEVEIDKKVDGYAPDELGEYNGRGEGILGEAGENERWVQIELSRQITPRFDNVSPTTRRLQWGKAAPPPPSLLVKPPIPPSPRINSASEISVPSVSVSGGVDGGDRPPLLSTVEVTEVEEGGGCGGGGGDSGGEIGLDASLIGGTISLDPTPNPKAVLSGAGAFADGGGPMIEEGTPAAAASE